VSRVRGDEEVDAFVSLLHRGGRAGLEQFESLATAHQYAGLYGLVNRHTRPGARVLDWGAGNGHFTFYLAQRPLQVTAFSFGPAPDILSRLTPEQSLRVTHVQGAQEEAVRLPFPDRSFDQVFSVGVLEHVREHGGSEAQSLTEIRRILRPGGLFIGYHLPNRYSWIEAVARALKIGRAPPEPPLWPGYHRYRFDRAQIEELVKGAGLSLIDLHAYGALPRQPFTHLPEGLRHARWLAGLVNRCDRALERPFARLVQNWAVVARADHPA
jgi:SAM-dependent methyltransferase